MTAKRPLLALVDDDDLDLVAGLVVADGGDHAGPAVGDGGVDGDHDVAGLNADRGYARVVRGHVGDHRPLPAVGAAVEL